eukprot:6452179-Alexandrium_andersonii.AAC.1
MGRSACGCRPCGRHCCGGRRPPHRSPAARHCSGLATQPASRESRWSRGPLACSQARPLSNLPWVLGGALRV